VHDGAAVSPGALLIGGTVVGRGAEIGSGVRLDGARCELLRGARVWPRVKIPDGGIRYSPTFSREPVRVVTVNFRPCCRDVGQSQNPTA
jgi:hypothetical protein